MSERVQTCFNYFDQIFVLLCYGCGEKNFTFPYCPRSGSRTVQDMAFDVMPQHNLKAHFYKNNAKPPIVTRNLHDPAPIFQANTHQNTGQNRANLV